MVGKKITDTKCISELERQPYHQTDISREEILNRLHEKGCRITKQRKALIDIILKEECSCCKEVYYRAVKIIPEIGVATVYRMLNVLEDIGAIKRDMPYKLCCFMDTELNTYTVELDSGKKLNLDEKQFRMVIEKGLKECGYLNDEKIIATVLNGR